LSTIKAYFDIIFCLNYTNFCMSILPQDYSSKTHTKTPQKTFTNGQKNFHKKNKIVMVSYPDSLGGDLKSLTKIADKYLKNSISGLHILPPYSSSADRGFCPLTHLKIDPLWGDWGDIQAISSQYHLTLDLICGHISDQSTYVQDYLTNGQKSEFADMFLPLSKVFPDKKISLDELVRLHGLTSVPPFINLKFADGSVIPHWKTFMPNQIELDANSAKTRQLYIEFLHHLVKNGVKMVRLDAVETIMKDRNIGFHLIPQTYEFINWMKDEAKKAGIEVLCETFCGLEQQKTLVNMDAWVYDFNLPDLIFHSIFTQNTHYIQNWFKSVLKNTVAILSNHDGFAVGLSDQILTKKEGTNIREKIFKNAGLATQQASGCGSNNVSSATINSTLYEALFRDQRDWLIAHAIHIFSPGVPHVYYNDLLMQTNDEALYHQTGEGRSLLRHNHSLEQIDHKFDQPAVQQVIWFMQIRKNHPAFDGKISVLPNKNPEILHLIWNNVEEKTELEIVINVAEKSINLAEKNAGQSDFSPLVFDKNILE